MDRKEEWLNIANTIIAQIRFTDPSALFAWGMQEPLGVKEFTDKESGMYYLGGLTFKADGIKVNVCRVYVLLNSRDLYDIRVHFMVNGELKTETREDIFCDQLTEFIDRIIERDPPGFVPPEGGAA